MRIRLSQLRRIIKEETKRAILREGLDANQESDAIVNLLFPTFRDRLVNEPDLEDFEELCDTLPEVTKDILQAADIVNSFAAGSNSLIDKYLERKMQLKDDKLPRIDPPNAPY